MCDCPRDRDRYYDTNVDESLFEEYRTFTSFKHKNVAPYQELVKARGLRWPVVEQPDGTWRETTYRFVEGTDPFVEEGRGVQFYHSTTNDDRAQIFFRPYVAPPEIPDAEYPLWLDTGRVLEHWHTGTMTMRIPQLRRSMPSAYVEINADDASDLGIRSGEIVLLETRHGSLELPAWIDGRGSCPTGHVFVPFFDERRLINHLTLEAHCPFSKEPDYKKCAVRISKAKVCPMTQHVEKPDADNDAEAIAPATTRLMSLAGAVVIGLALVGFLLGITEGEPRRRATAAASVGSSGAAVAVVAPAATYPQMNKADFRPNAAWENKLTDLKVNRPSRMEPVVRTLEMKLAAIADRAKNRAFDGAPPVIPHRVEQQSAGSCLVCHGEGLKLGDQLATRISHAHFTSCTQCHVEEETSFSIAQAPTTPKSTATVPTFESTFVGLYRSGLGTRLSPGAPPTIPHSILLREDCMSCHGTITRPGLRTTHPWLSNCSQCHAPSASLDQTGMLWDQL